MLNHKLIFLLASATVSNLVLTWSIYRAFHNPQLNPWITAEEKHHQFHALRMDPNEIKHYTFEGDDYPPFAPINLPQQPVRMTIEESVHYSPSYPHLSTQEWLYNSPWGAGTYRAGSGHRVFYVTAFHDLHCLRHLHHTLLDPRHFSKGWGHLQHCFNTVRQSILCQADMTLEEGDFTKRDFATDRFGATHICRDWEAVYDEVGMNWVQWRRYIKATNLSIAD